jgi:hypothetical protein
MQLTIGGDFSPGKKSPELFPSLPWVNLPDPGALPQLTNAGKEGGYEAGNISPW